MSEICQGCNSTELFECRFLTALDLCDKKMRVFLVFDFGKPEQFQEIVEDISDRRDGFHDARFQAE